MLWARHSLPVASRKRKISSILIVGVKKKLLPQLVPVHFTSSSSFRAI